MRFKVRNDDGTYLRPKLIIRVDGKYSTAMASDNALKEFKKIGKKIPNVVEAKKQDDVVIRSTLTQVVYDDESNENNLEEIMETTRTFEDENVMVDTNPKTSPIEWLTEDENRGLQDVLDPNLRLEDNSALQEAINRIDGAIESVNDEIDNIQKQLKLFVGELKTRDSATKSELHNRIDALKGLEEA